MLIFHANEHGATNNGEDRNAQVPGIGIRIRRLNFNKRDEHGEGQAHKNKTEHCQQAGDAAGNALKQ